MVQDLKTMINDICRNVPGSLSADVCTELCAVITESLPKDGVILDLNCGAGRSTVISAKALDLTEKTDAQILAVDTHVTNPNSSNPHEEGTLIPFLRYLRIFKVMRRVFPLVAPASAIPQLFNKKCANLVLVQTGGPDALPTLIHAAHHAIRKGGKIVILYKDYFVGDLMGKDYERADNFKHIQVWTAIGGKEK